MHLTLVRYSEITEDQYLDYITEWEQNEEHIIPSASKRNNREFAQIMKKWYEDETDIPLQNGFVPSTLFFLINDNKRILGAIHFRHYLNDRLYANGGHIGYGVRKSERRKGYAHEMLKSLISEIKKYSIKRVMITCDDDNIGSIRTIESCGGVLQDKVEFENVMTRRYWLVVV